MALKENDILLSLKNVKLTLDGPHNKPITILSKVNMEVQQGTMVSITGPSGSGKTSLMMLISGVERASSGTISICNHDITHYSEDELALFRREHIGVVFQNFHLVPTMTAFENVEIALELAGHDDCTKKANQALEEVGLAKRGSHYPSQLSGGEQQRVALARAFATKPKLLLADEPTGNLDSENGKHITQLMMDMTEKNGTTLVLITHDMGMAALASQQFVMNDGELHEK